MNRVCRPFSQVAMLAGLSLLLALGVLLATPLPTQAATITVTGAGNTQGNDGFCTLVEALNNANNDNGFHLDCTAGSGVDTVNFNIPSSQCSATACTILTDIPYQIVGPTTIDGFSQPGASPNTMSVGTNAILQILLRPTTSGVTSALRIVADDVTVRGLGIANYSQYGIVVEGGARARIVGCFVGTNDVGTVSFPNGLGGIRVAVSAVNTFIGGTSPADRNVISGHSVGDGKGIFLDGASHANIQNNYVGLKAHGQESLPNRSGIYVNGGFSNTIGGSTPAARNVISGNTGAGNSGSGVVLTAMNLHLATASLNVLQGNYIGSRADGQVGSTPNDRGVYIESPGNTIGGTAPGAGNVIVGSNLENVAVSGLYGTGNAILGNVITSAPLLGIDLGTTGINQNDPGDADSGANRLQNYPALTSVGIGANTTVSGTLNSTPGRTYRIEVFSNTACDPSGYGEGETYLGSVNAATDGAGSASFVGTFPLVSLGRQITATATDLTTNDTSEFSRCRVAEQAAITVTTFTFTTTETNENNGFDARFSIHLDTQPSANVTISLAVSDPTEGVLVSPATLTFTPANGMLAQTVQVLGVDDGIDDGNVPFIVITGPATSTDPNYNGRNPRDMPMTNVDDDSFAAQCGPRPKVNVSLVKVGGGQLRATVTVGRNGSNQNELQSITWTKMDTANVVLDGVGAVQVGQTSTFGPLTQSRSFTITRTPGAQSGTVSLTVTDACGAWPTFVGGGPNAW